MEAFGTYRCVSCRKGPLVGGDEMLSCTILPGSSFGDFSDEEISCDNTSSRKLENFLQISSTSSNLNKPSSFLSSQQGTSDKIIEQYSNVSTPQDNPSPSTTSNSIRGSETPTPQPDEVYSDNDEYQPPRFFQRKILNFVLVLIVVSSLQLVGCVESLPQLPQTFLVTHL